jgi:2-phosphoglycerate kinase
LVTEPSAWPEGPLVILLGGAPGTGKTTIANLLMAELGLSHHLSTGFIRASVSPLLSEADARILQHHTYDAYQALNSADAAAISTGDDDALLLEGVIRQSMLLKPSVESCIIRARREGIGMVLEGSHFLPGVLESSTLEASLLCILDVPDREALKLRVLSPNHSRRRLSDAQLGRLVRLQEGILGLAQVHGQPVVINENLSKATKQIRTLVGR